MSGTRLKPAAWPIECTQGDTLPVETVEVVVEVGGVETPVAVTAVVAQVREHRDRSSDLVVDLDGAFSGSSVSWGGVVVPDRPGVWRWDLQVTGTAGAVAVDLTLLGDTFSIHRDVSHV